MEEESEFDLLSEEVVEAIGLSESFVKRFNRFLSNLPEQQREGLINDLKKKIRDQFVNVLNEVKVEKDSNSFSLSSLEQSYLNSLTEEKQELFGNWLMYLKEQGAKSLGKQRLDVFVDVFEQKSVQELKEEINYRVNLGHSGLLFKGGVNTSSTEGIHSSSSQSYLDKITEESKRISQELAKKHNNSEE